MNAKKFKDWLIENEYPEKDRAKILVIKDNYDHTYYGLPQKDMYEIKSLILKGTDVLDVQLEQNPIQQTDLPHKEAPYNLDGIPDRLELKIEGRDFTLEDVGHSDGTFYVRVLDENDEVNE